MEKVMGQRAGDGCNVRTRRFMECTLLRLPLIVLALSCLQLPNTDSETSYHTSWRLDPGQGKVMPSVGSNLNPPPEPVNTRPTSDSQMNSQLKHSRGLHEKSNININQGNEATPSEGIADAEFIKMQEEVLQILLSTETTADGTWRKTENSSKYCSKCPRPAGGGGTAPTAIIGRQPMHTGEDSSGVLRNNRGLPIIGVQGAPRPPETNNDGIGSNSDDVYTEPGHNGQSNDLIKEDVLDCGKTVNFTYYDHLVGIQNRANHIHIPEPEVALTFQNGKNGHFGGGSSSQKSHKSSTGDGSKNGSSGLSRKTGAASDVNIDAIEKRLKRAKREKPKSVELYNQIGNFWRIRGDTQKSIECFRRALAVSPNNADILLNLGRVLFNLNYLDDAIFLTRRSLEVQPPDQNAWAQHFQLGEILKAYCHYQEAALHLRHVLELKPNYQPALSALADMESMPDSTVHVYTVFIIVFLVLAVLIWILSTLDISLEEMLGFSSASKSSSEQSNGTVANGSSHPNSSRSFNRLQRFHSRNGGKRFA